MGVSKIVLYAACTLNAGLDTFVVARAESTSYTASVESLELSEATSFESGVDSDSFSSQVIIVVPLVVTARVGFGKVVAVGDSNLFSGGGALPGAYVDQFNNLKLLQNIVDW